MTDAELRTWAEAHSTGPMTSPVAEAVLRVMGERDAAEKCANSLETELAAECLRSAKLKINRPAQAGGQS